MTAHGTLLIELPTEEAMEGKCDPASPVALITEHRPFESRQRTLRFDGNAGAAALLPVGDYTVVVTANGYEPFRAFAKVCAGNTTTVKAKLVERKGEGPTFEDILKKNLVQRDPRSLRDLTVGGGQTLVLDPKAKDLSKMTLFRRPKIDLSRDLNYVELHTLQEVKQVLGVPDSVFVGDRPRFGRFSPSRPP